MAHPADPTEAIRQMAAAFPHADQGTSCNQSSFKANKRAFLFVGPGAKGIGWKAMFKLGPSMDEAAALARKEPGRFEIGGTGWVTTRFSTEEPLAKSLWTKWLRESYALAVGDIPGAARGSATSPRRKTASRRAAGPTAPRRGGAPRRARRGR